MQSDYVFCSESVTAGHPDKLCDQVSDAIVGGYAGLDPRARISAECALSTGIAFVSVMHRTDVRVNIVETARSTLLRAGYTEPPFDARSCSILLSVHEAKWKAVEDDLDSLVAEEPATVFGFACNDTPSLMPLPIHLAHELARRLHEVHREHVIQGLTPDGEVQAAVEYRARRPSRIHGVSVIPSWAKLSPAQRPRLREELFEHVVRAVFRDEPLRPDEDTRISIDPGECIVPGGPAFHAGLTGRKTAVDTYGGIARHGGAALSGKDVFRIDRSGAYAARHVAKNVVAARLADACEVQISYAVGLAAPVSVQVETYGTARISEDVIAERIRRVFDLRVGRIVRALGLRDLVRTRGTNIFTRLAAYGQVGRTDLELPWEAVDRAAELA